jgi:hypothetical protein
MMGDVIQLALKMPCKTELSHEIGLILPGARSGTRRE